MVNIKNGIILSILLFVLVGIFGINEKYGANTTLENNIFGKLNIEKTQSVNLGSALFQENSGPEAIELNFSGEVLSCTNKSDVERVIDLRLSNLVFDNKYITIYPLNLTINLLPEQIKRIDIFLPTGISILQLVSSDGEEYNVQVPTCFSGGSSGSSKGGTASFVKQTTTPRIDEIPEFPSIVLPVISILALLFIMNKKK